MHKYYLDDSGNKWIYTRVRDENNYFYCRELKQIKVIHISELTDLIKNKEIELLISEL